jgi:hypothetical protein
MGDTTGAPPTKTVELETDVLDALLSLSERETTPNEALRALLVANGVLKPTALDAALKGPFSVLRISAKGDDETEVHVEATFFPPVKSWSDTDSIPLTHLYAATMLDSAASTGSTEVISATDADGNTKTPADG